MIAYIKGKLTYILDETVIVDVGGVGYEINCANPFLFQAALNEEVLIYTYQHVRDDAHILYGFKDEDEKYLFTKLISVSGIGPKSALAIQGSVDINAFVTAVEQEDEKFLTSFPGVGKKTAGQIILDLKGKLVGMLSVSGDLFTPEGQAPKDLGAIKEAEAALTALGYSDKEIRAIAPELHKETDSNVDTLIRKALALLMKN